MEFRPDTKLIPNGLVRRCISMNGSDGKRYRVLSYFFPCHVQHFYAAKGKRIGRGPLQTPSEQPKFARFIKEWITFNFAKERKQKMDDALTLLPESMIPLDVPASHQVPDGWDHQEMQCQGVLTQTAVPVTPETSSEHEKQRQCRKRKFSVMQEKAVDTIPTPNQSLDTSAADILLQFAQQPILIS
ncbi:UNVERIFIED_CONTAM: hypothetical protein HDU68_005435 [Siphonaria sp. JEL0065]|nr:hypothetical protein HDU68_005435 [Siphonaria sp. JEL0065]